MIFLLHYLDHKKILSFDFFLNFENKHILKCPSEGCFDAPQKEYYFPCKTKREDVIFLSLLMKKKERPPDTKNVEIQKKRTNQVMPGF